VSETSPNSTSNSSTPFDMTHPDFFQSLYEDLITKVPPKCFLATILILTITNILTLVACCCCARRRKRRMSHSLVDNNFGHSLYDVSPRVQPPRPPRRDNSTLLINERNTMTLDRVKRSVEGRESSEFILNIFIGIFMNVLIGVFKFLIGFLISLKNLKNFQFLY
jgi:hypothetical protein